MQVVTDAVLARHARQFRDALDAVDPETWKRVTVTAFPGGACGHATELLGRYLRDQTGIEADYVVKDLRNPDGSWRSGHAWLEYEGLILDITGDQFGWPPVIVDRNSALHAEADDNDRYALTSDHQWWGIYYAPVYAEALRWLAAHGDGSGCPLRR